MFLPKSRAYNLLIYRLKKDFYREVKSSLKIIFQIVQHVYWILILHTLWFICLHGDIVNIDSCSWPPVLLDVTTPCWHCILLELPSQTLNRHAGTKCYLVYITHSIIGYGIYCLQFAVGLNMLNKNAILMFTLIQLILNTLLFITLVSCFSRFDIISFDLRESFLGK